MKNKIKIITDTCSSLTKEELDNMGVDYVETNFMIDGTLNNGFDEFKDSNEEFYNNLKNIKSVSTGCVNVQSYTDVFSKYVNDGYDIVFIGLSGGLSSSFSNACLSAEELNNQYGKHIYTANSLTGSFGIAKMINEALSMVKQDCSAEEIYNKLNNNGLKTLSIFIPGSLTFLTKSGRISKLVAGVGSLLHIVPIISTDENGKLKMIAKSLGRKKAITTLNNILLTRADLENEETIYIGHTNQLQEAEELKEFILANTKNKKVKIGYIDRTMGCHCGPGTLAVFATTK